VTDADLIAAGIPLDQSVSKFTPRVAFNYQFMDDLMGYASWTTGFKSGGWNARGGSAAELAAFGEEEVDSYELGMRSEWLDRSLRVNLTGFFVEYTDLQIASVIPGTTIFGTNNAGDSEVKGLEVEGSWNATDNLNFYGNLGLMDNEYTRLTMQAAATGIGPDLDRTPDSNALLGFNYTVPASVVGGGIYFGGQASWTDDYWIGSDNNPTEDLIEEHTLVNLHVGWLSDSDRWEVIVECKNCFDEEWLGNNFFNTLFPSDPVRWGVRLKYRYN
jgi:iron complex outermembrane receptor protein